MKKIFLIALLFLSLIPANSQDSLVLDTKEKTLEFLQYYNTTLNQVDKLLVSMEAASRDYNVIFKNEPQLPRVKNQLLALAQEIDFWINSKKFNNIVYLKYQPNSNVKILIGKKSELDETAAFLNPDNVLNTSISDFITKKIQSIHESNSYLVVPEIQRALGYFRLNISQALLKAYEHQASFLAGSLNNIFK